ncbi:DNA polymerase IV [bacterium]|nr:DNA polymerase IV [bacterium]
MRHIAHLDLDTFFVSVERLIDPKLIGKPVLIGSASDRGVVAACSYEARAFSIHSAMPMKMAKQLCPEAIIVRGNSGDYMKYSDMVTEIIRETVPLFEKTSVDEFYLDLTGLDRFFGCYRLTSELRQRIIKETGLPISFGLSVNKTVSKVATGEAKPNNQMEIGLGLEKAFLAPLSIKKIPMVGTKTYQTLRNLGVKRIETLQEMPLELLENVFGKNGRTLWEKANGIDLSPVVAYSERKSISTERTFERDTIDIVKLKGILTAMAESLAFQLRSGQKLTSCVMVKIRYSDFETKTLQQRIPYTSGDHILLPVVQELFDKLFNRRVLVRLIGVQFSHLVSGSYQVDLFENVNRTIKLYQAMDSIRNRFGGRSVVRASGMDATSIGRSNPFTGNPPLLLANRRQ